MTRGRGRGKTKSRGGQDPAKQLEHAPSENIDPNEQPASQLSQQDTSGFCVCKEEPVEPDNTLPAIGTLTTIQTPVIKMEHKDWQIKKDLVTCSSYMLKEEINTDVSFSVGKEGTLIKAHKLILAMRSPVFERMFFGAFPEAQNHPIPLPDVEPSAFRNLLAYVYSDNADILVADSFSTMYVGRKYVLPDLEEASRNSLIENLDKDSLWLAYAYSLQWDDKELQIACEEYFLKDVEHMVDTLKSPYFSKLPRGVLQEVLKLHCPENGWRYIGTEWKWNGADPSTEEPELLRQKPDGKGILYISDMTLFEACSSWASTECSRQEIEPTGPNKRKVLGDCLRYIQFPLMLPSDIANSVSPSGILTMEEMTSLYTHLLWTPKNVPELKLGRHNLLLYLDKPYPGKDHFTSAGGMCTSLVLLHTPYRLLLSKIWMTGGGGSKYYIPQSLTVSVYGPESKITWAKYICKTQIQDQHFDQNSCPLGYAPLEPMILNANCRYAITMEHERNFFNLIKHGHPKESEETPLLHSAYLAGDLSINTSIIDGSKCCITALTVSYV